MGLTIASSIPAGTDFSSLGLHLRVDFVTPLICDARCRHLTNLWQSRRALCRSVITRKWHRRKWNRNDGYCLWYFPPIPHLVPRRRPIQLLSRPVKNEFFRNDFLCTKCPKHIKLPVRDVPIYSTDSRIWRFSCRHRPWHKIRSEKF